jgi:hypothetical protein
MKFYIDESSWHGQNWFIDESLGQIFCTKKKVYYSNTHVCLSIMPMATCIWTS